jgi:hypothetical protein
MIVMKFESLEIDKPSKFKRKRVDDICMQTKSFQRCALAEPRRNRHELVAVCIHGCHEAKLVYVAGEGAELIVADNQSAQLSNIAQRGWKNFHVVVRCIQVPEINKHANLIGQRYELVVIKTQSLKITQCA